ncbi:hypothetical protein HPB52_021233 [Rhipicephalus sanguineus]|uniref:Uncharacterized protein n=1 Tax=Rhipicephalus sanguineus TaxID=34632 RepID=A0A9D4T1U2_RHISA|nr:hypothetical protein HPB52_021233 [Rhipicephalus sanguineus]
MPVLTVLATQWMTAGKGLALNLDISIRERRPAPDFKVSLLMAVQFIFAAWAEVGSSTIVNCFCKVGFAGDYSEAEVEGRDAPANAEMTELWSSVNGGDGDASGLEEFLHADDAVAKNEDLTDEAIVAAVTGAEDESSDDEEEPEPMQAVSHQEALQMIDRLRDFVFAKNLPLGHAQQMDALQKDSQKPRKVDCPWNLVSGGSPRVHRPRARLSFTRPSAQEACEELGDTDVVPSSQSTVDSSEEVEVAKLGQDKPLMDPHPESPVTVWLQDKEKGRLIASQEAPLSPAKHQRSLRMLVHEDGGDSPPKNARHTRGWLLANGPIRWQDELLENGIAPLDDHVPTNSVPAEQNIEEHGDSSAVHAEEARTTQESTDTEIYEDQLEGEEPVTKEAETSPPCEPSAASPALVNSEECVLQLSEGSSACYSEGTMQASQASPEFGAPIPSSEDTNRVELAMDTEEQIGNVCPAGVDVHESFPAGHSCPDICTVPETEDQATIESWEPQSVTDTAASKPESMLAQGKAVRGARKRKLPSQTTSPISSRLRAKQVRQEQVRRSSSPPPDAAGGKPPPRWSGSSPALSRSRIMLDAAMRSVGSSPSRHTANVPFAQQSADDGGSTGPLPSILKRRPPAEDGSPQGSPHRAKAEE